MKQLRVALYIRVSTLLMQHPEMQVMNSASIANVVAGKSWRSSQTVYPEPRIAGLPWIGSWHPAGDARWMRLWSIAMTDSPGACDIWLTPYASSTI